MKPCWTFFLRLDISYTVVKADDLADVNGRKVRFLLTESGYAHIM
jgi:hypothetical protein